MALRPDEFYDRALAASDGERRLPLARMTEWEISPFEQAGLRVAPLRPPVLPEPARHGEDPSECNSCRNRDKGIWFSDRWRLTRIGGVGVPLALMLHPRDHYDVADLPDVLAAELGVLTTHIARHVEALAHIARAHVYRLGDGGAHLHVWFFARPEGQAQRPGWPSIGSNARWIWRFSGWLMWASSWHRPNGSAEGCGRERRGHERDDAGGSAAPGRCAGGTSAERGGGSLLGACAVHRRLRSRGVAYLSLERGTPRASCAARLPQRAHPQAQPDSAGTRLPRGRVPNGGTSVTAAEPDCS